MSKINITGENYGGSFDPKTYNGFPAFSNTKKSTIDSHDVALESSEPKETIQQEKLEEVTSLPATASEAYEQLFGTNALKLNEAERKFLVEKIAIQFGDVLLPFEDIKAIEKRLMPKLLALINKPR